MSQCTKCYSPGQSGAWDLCTPDINYSYNIAVNVITQSMPCIEKAGVRIDLEICSLKLPDLNHAGLAYRGFLWFYYVIFIS